MPFKTGDIKASKSGRKGGVNGGKKRAQNMTSEQRTESARKAAQARWSPKVLIAQKGDIRTIK